MHEYENREIKTADLGRTINTLAAEGWTTDRPEPCEWETTDKGQRVSAWMIFAKRQK